MLGSATSFIWLITVRRSITSPPKNFADGVWNQKVDTGGVEVKGAIHEIEVRSQAYADWVFVPVRAGHYDVRCVVPGHTEAGMVGSIDVIGEVY